MKQRRVAVLVVVSFVFGESVGVADPPLLGLTEAQLTQRLGQPNPDVFGEIIPERLRKTYEPSPPTVKVLFFPWKKFPVATALSPRGAMGQYYIAIGFDSRGIARTARPEGQELNPKVASEFRNAVASGWASDTDTIKIFPPLQQAQVVAKEVIHWRDTGVGIAWGTPGAVIDGIKASAQIRPVSTTKDKSIYCQFELGGEVKPMRHIKCRWAEAFDAETFWTRHLDLLFKLWKDGEPIIAQPVQGVDPYATWSPWPYEDTLCAFLSRPDKFGDTRSNQVQRFTDTVVAMVKHPTLDLSVIRRAAMHVAEQHNQTLSRELVKLLKADDMTTRDRAARSLAWFDDPAAFEPLIAALAANPPVASAAATLRALSREDFGDQPEAWKKWWNDNRKPLEQSYAAKLLDRAGRLAVGWNRKASVYHLHSCPKFRSALLAGDGAKATLQEARQAGARPCPTCNPKP